MKQTHKLSYEQQEKIGRLVELLSAKEMLDKKVRINLYLPMAVVKLMDYLARDFSRGELVSSLVIKEMGKKQKLPFGMFKGVNISEKEIDKITSHWERAVNEIV